MRSCRPIASILSLRPVFGLLHGDLVDVPQRLGSAGADIAKSPTFRRLRFREPVRGRRARPAFSPLPAGRTEVQGVLWVRLMPAPSFAGRVAFSTLKKRGRDDPHYSGQIRAISTCTLGKCLGVRTPSRRTCAERRYPSARYRISTVRPSGETTQTSGTPILA